MDKKQFILDFIKRHKIGVIATVGADAKPESAVVEFAQTDNFELIFHTFDAARKFKNLKTNQNISFVIGWDQQTTVQYEGVAKEVHDQEARECQNIFWQKNPIGLRWSPQAGNNFFKITPTWIRYTDLNKDPWEIIELSTAELR